MTESKKKDVNFNPSTELQEVVGDVKRLVSVQQKSLRNNEKVLVHLERKFQSICEKVDSWEDCLAHVLHNIKKNQFLYAHYPDEWVKDYVSIKEGIKYENGLMDQKINALQEKKIG